MKKKTKPSSPKPKPAETQMPDIVDEANLLSDLRSLIRSARQRIATVANSTAILLFSNVGRRLLRENLQAGRAAYGKQILATVSQELTAESGRGFSYAEIARMIQFSQLFPDEAIVVTLSQQLSWTHFHALLSARLHQAIEHAREQAARRLSGAGEQP